MCVVGVQILSALLYMVIFIISYQIDQRDVYTDLTIYTQGIAEWETPLWKDFSWGVDGKCADGSSYEDINSLWLGTVEGNYTDNGVKPTDTDFDG